MNSVPTKITLLAHMFMPTLPTVPTFTSNDQIPLSLSIPVNHYFLPKIRQKCAFFYFFHQNIWKRANVHHEAVEPHREEATRLVASRRSAAGAD